MTDLAQLGEALRERGFGVTHSVRITDCGRTKIPVIRTVRELTGWGLKEAKDAADKLATIVDAVSLEAAQHAAAQLQEAGATVEIGVGELHLYAFDPTDPRRGDQPIERLRVLGSAIALEHGRLGAWTPEPVRPLELELVLTAIDERRHAWAEAGKHESFSEQTILERVSARERALEHRLRTTDGEARAREAAVYGDWLQTQGDPRGLIAAAALAVTETGDDERRLELERLLSAHSSHLFGPGRELLESAKWTWFGPALDSLLLEPVYRDGNAFPVPTFEPLAELLGTPACACLRSLALERQIDRDEQLGELLRAAACAPGLHELRIINALNLTLHGDTFVRLETLAIHGRFTLGPAKLPALRRLDLRIVVPLAPLVASFVQLDTPALEHFAISVTTYEYWDQNYGPLQTNLFELLSQPAFAKLRTLKIVGGPLLVGFARLLARQPAIATLEQIDLRGAEMTTECRAELERSRDRLPGLVLSPAD